MKKQEYLIDIQAKNDWWNRPFEITSICREDLREIRNADDQQYFTDQEIINVSDERMRWLAGKIADGIMTDFWMILDDLRDDLKK